MTRIIKIIAAALVPLLLSACNKTPEPPMVFGASAWPGYEPVYLAREQGYLAAANLRLAEYASDQEVKKAFREHALYAAALPLDEAMQLRRDIPDLKIVLLLDASNGADALLAQSGITDVRQLQGRRVGRDGMGRGAYFLDLALQGAGMQPGQVEAAALSQEELEAAFRARKLDAVVVAGAGRSRLLDAGAQLLSDSSRVPGKILDVLVVRDNDIGTYHGELVQLIQGWQHALEFVHTQPEKAVQSMAGHEHMDAAQFSRAMQGIEFLGLPRNRDLLLGDPPAVGASLDAVQRFLLDRGLINMGANADTLLDTALLPEEKK